MGYTIENKKIVIWTEKEFVADPWPFNDEGTNYTKYYENLKSRSPFTRTLASLTDERKHEIVSKFLNLEIGTFILKSNKSHHKQQAKGNP